MIPYAKDPHGYWCHQGLNHHQLGLGLSKGVSRYIFVRQKMGDGTSVMKFGLFRPKFPNNFGLFALPKWTWPCNYSSQNSFQFVRLGPNFMISADSSNSSQHFGSNKKKWKLKELNIFLSLKVKVKWPFWPFVLEKLVGSNVEQPIY